LERCKEFDKIKEGMVEKANQNMQAQIENIQWSVCWSLHTVDQAR
jgi:hypothetical protein